MEVDDPTLRPPKESRFVDPIFGVWRCEHLLVQRFDGVHTDESADRLVAESRAMVKFGATGSILIHLGPNAKPPTAASRQKYTNVMNENSGRLFGVSYLMEGTGFAASMQRSVLIGINLLTKHNMPTHVTSTAPLAVAWLETMGLPSADAKKLLQMHHQIETEMNALASPN